MAIEVFGTLKPKNNGKFPVVEAKNVGVGNGKRLDEELQKLNDSVGSLNTENIEFVPYNILEGLTLTTSVGAVWSGSGYVTTNQYSTYYTAINEKIDVIAGCTYLFKAYMGAILLFYDNGAVGAQVNLSEGKSKAEDIEWTPPEGVSQIGIYYRHNEMSMPLEIYRLTQTSEDNGVYIKGLRVIPENLQEKETQKFIRGLAFEDNIDAFIPPNVLDGISLTYTTGGSWGSGGAIVSNQYTTNSTAINEKIDVIEGCTYRIPHFNGNIQLYDKNGVNGTQISQHSSPVADFVFEIPVGKSKIGITFTHTDIAPVTKMYRETVTEEEKQNSRLVNKKFSLLLENINDKKMIALLVPLKGKEIVNFGDSIFGMFSPPDDISTFLSEYTGATVYNCGFGGCRMASHSSAYYDPFSMYRLADAVVSGDFELQEQALADAAAAGETGALVTKFPTTLALLKTIDFNKVDIITIAYGTNDWQGYPLLDSESNPMNTDYIAGALRYSIEKILTAYPHLKIFVCSPIYRCWNNADGTLNYDSDSEESKKNGVLLTDIVSKEKEVAQEYHLPFIDNYYELGINKINRLKYFTVSDGTHPNVGGRKLIAEHIAKKLF